MPQAQDQRQIDLGHRLQRFRDHWCDHLSRCISSIGDVVSQDDHATLTELGGYSALGKLGLQRLSAGGKFKIGNDQLLDELLGAHHNGAVPTGDHGVAVENQLVLAADEVDVGQRTARFPGATPDQVAADVVLVALVRAGVDHRQQAGVRLCGRRDRAAVLPQVFTDGNRDVDATDAQYMQLITGLEIAVLV